MHGSDSIKWYAQVDDSRTLPLSQLASAMPTLATFPNPVPADPRNATDFHGGENCSRTLHLQVLQ